MFERRLKILLGILATLTVLLLSRSAQLQIAESADWREQAANNMTREQFFEPVRGSIIDRRGRKLASDEPCMNALVDYRAIIREPRWMREQAVARLRARAPADYSRAGRLGRGSLVQEEIARVSADIDSMWLTLARVSGKPLEEIEQTKASIRRRVEMRRRWLWYTKYEQAVQRYRKRPAESSLRQWLLSEQAMPQLDSFAGEVSDESEPHVILRNIPPEVHIQLRKRQDNYPGLVLEHGKHRYYPYRSVACHTIGQLSIVTREDLERDPTDDHDLRHYIYNDLIGRSGVEALSEKALRGTRGRIERVAGRDAPVDSVEAVNGRDVRITIDIDLQAQLEGAFQSVQWKDAEGNVIEQHEMHGAAVVLDVATNQVLALISCPVYDLNDFEQRQAALRRDRLNLPLLNRATQMALEPGSTLKPVVGLGAIAQGLISTSDTIECTGFLVMDGHRQPHGKCWVATMYLDRLKEEGVRHHQVPDGDKHPTGFLNFSDALQRSCNVFFENLGDRLKLEGLSYWCSRFGLGRRSGIGLPESTGRLPRQYRGPSSGRRSAAWYSAIGQYQITATPIQMANIAATIARDGVWMRPRLVMSDADMPTTRPSQPERVDLHLPPAAVRAAKEGMWRVVNTLAGSAYREIRRDDLIIAGKTGTAQVGKRLSIILADDNDKPIRNERGQCVRYEPAISTRDAPNPSALWYRGTGRTESELSHAWFIGYAPAERPTIAFAVVLEYGGSGGHDAAPIVRALLDACLEHGYVAKK